MDSLTPVQAGRTLGVSERIVYRLIRGGFLPSYKRGRIRQHWIKKEDLLIFQEQYPSLPKLPPVKQYKKNTGRGVCLYQTSSYKEERLAYAKASAERRGGECLSSRYENSMKHLAWRCEEGHEWTSTFTTVVTCGSWCPQCQMKKSKVFHRPPGANLSFAQL